MSATPETLRVASPRPVPIARLAALAAAVSLFALFADQDTAWKGAFVYALGAGLVVLLWRHVEVRPSARVLLALPLAVLVIRMWFTIGWRSGQMQLFLLAPLLLYLVVAFSGAFLRVARARATPWWLAVLGTTAFAAVGVSFALTIPFILAFPVLLALGAIRLERDGSNTNRELHLLLAVATGWTVTWLGVALHVRHWPQHDVAAWFAWRSEFPNDDPFQTFMVAGFPLQAIQGHGMGGAQEWLPWHKGLWCLLANFGLCTIAAFVAIFPLPRSLRAFAAYLLVLPAAVAGLTGGWQLLYMLD